MNDLAQRVTVSSQGLQRKRAYGQLSWGVNFMHPSLIGDFSSADRCGFACLNSSRLLCLLGFSYACGIFASQEIVRNCCTDQWFRNCSGATVPFRNELVLFRRRHRATLEQILTRVFSWAVAGAGREPSESSQSVEALLEEAKERLDFARHLDSCDE